METILEASLVNDVWDMSIGKLLRERIKQASPNKCFTCSYKKGLTIHHIIPTQCGGLDISENKVLLCENCHIVYHRPYKKFRQTAASDKQLIERLFRMRLWKELCSEFREL